MQFSTENLANDGKIFTVTFYGDTGTKRACVRVITEMDFQPFRQPGAQGSNRFEDEEGCVLLLERNIKVEYLFSK